MTTEEYTWVNDPDFFSDDELKEAETGKRRVYKSLVEMPYHQYKGGHNLACPECYRPVRRGLKDGRCKLCLHDRNLLEVNYLRTPKKREEEEDE